MNFFDQTNRMLDIGNAIKVVKLMTIALIFGAIGAAVFAVIKYL